MLLRIRSPTGTARLTVDGTTPGEDLAKMILDTIPSSEAQPDPSSIKLSNRPGSSGEVITLDALKGRKVGDMGLNHGDLLFLSYKPLEADPNSHPTTESSSHPPHPDQPDPSHPHTHTDPPLPGVIPLPDLSQIEEADVDIYWNGQDGKIERKRDARFCRHGDKGMCDYCMPLEPFDAKYQSEHQIKHLSFHSYLRKILSTRSASSASSSAQTLPPLTPLSLSVMTPCPTGAHPPFPAGICSTCQPSALTLTSQAFRTVDHVEFSSPAIINGLLDAWRRTGTQRLGFLIGRFDKYEKVPMGVKSVVEAVWEPRQEGEVDGLTIETPWTDQDRVSEIAGWCEKGLGVVGMIYTDLTPAEEDVTKVLYKRHAQSFTASSLEMLLSAAYQISHPLQTKSSTTGLFSSRFVTCCLTGTEEGGIDVIAWQATEQAEAMVKAGIVEASVDPGTVRVRKAGEGEYIPEVFYSFKNEYGIQVKMPAKPTFPVEYLFVNVTHGFPNDPNPLFRSNSFPTENRPGLHDQSLEVVIAQLSSIVKDGDARVGDLDTWPPRIRNEVAKWLSDWHLVAFLCMQGLFSLEEQKLLCRAATAHAHLTDKEAVELFFHCGGWQTLLTIAESSTATNGFASPGRGGTPSAAFDAMGIDSPSIRDIDNRSGSRSAGNTSARSATPIVRPSSAAPSASASRVNTGGGDDTDLEAALAASAADAASMHTTESAANDAGGGASSGGGSGGSGGGIRVCPHCTFENEAGRSDCEICGLPLDG